jgi:hypothetical protein
MHACLIALNLSHNASLSVELVDAVLETGAMYKSDQHSGLEDVFPHVSRYSVRIDFVHFLLLGRPFFLFVT